MRGGVVVYGVKGCAQCTWTVKALRRGGVVVEVIDLETAPAARAMVEAMDFTQAPVVATPGAWWQGLEPELIKDAVRRYGRARAREAADSN